MRKKGHMARGPCWGEGDLAAGGQRVDPGRDSGGRVGAPAGGGHFFFSVGAGGEASSSTMAVTGFRWLL